MRVGSIGALTFVLLGLSVAQGARAQQLGNFCVRDFRPGAVCAAGDVRMEAILPVQVNEDCESGVPGEAEILAEILMSTQDGPARYDVGLFISLDGQSARDGDLCRHDDLAPPLTLAPSYGDANLDGISDIEGSPWWGGDLDSCGDMEASTQAIQSQVLLRFACTDTNADGSVDLSVCTS